MNYSMLSVSPSAYISTSHEVPIEIHGCLRFHRDGRVERLIGNNTIAAGTDQSTAVQSKDVVISQETNLSVRLYVPETATAHRKLPTLIYYHGGGFMTESSASTTYHPTLNLITSEANVVTVSVDYRLTPEHPIPIPYEDSWDTVRWVASHVGSNGPEPWLNQHADLDNVFLAGDSCGANIAHNMAILIGLNSINPITNIVTLRGVIMLHPYFQGSDPIGPESGKDRDFKALSDLIWKIAGRGQIGLDDPLINPAKNSWVSSFGCSRILLCVAEKDKCLVRGLNYKKVMEESGWNGTIELLESKGEKHVFFLYDTSTKNACSLRTRICEFVNPIRSKV